MFDFSAEYNSNRRDIAKLQFIQNPRVVKIPRGYHQVCHGEVIPGDKTYRQTSGDFVLKGRTGWGASVSLYWCVIRKDGGVIQAVGCTREDEYGTFINLVDYDTEQTYDEDTDVVAGNGAFVSRIPVDFVVGPGTQAEIESALKRKEE